MFKELIKRVASKRKGKLERAAKEKNDRLQNTINHMSGLSFSWNGCSDVEFLTVDEVKSILRSHKD